MPPLPGARPGQSRAGKAEMRDRVSQQGAREGSSLPRAVRLAERWPGSLAEGPAVLTYSVGSSALLDARRGRTGCGTAKVTSR